MLLIGRTILADSFFFKSIAQVSATTYYSRQRGPNQYFLFKQHYGEALG